MKDEEAAQLAELIPQEQGAFIEEFCRTYHGQRWKEILHQREFSTLVEALKVKYSRNGEKKPEKSKSGIGFRQ